MIGLPGPLLEALNGIMIVLFFCMLLSAAWYFVERLRTESSIFKVYAQSKASFAASILFAGLFMRTGVIWWARHVADHDFRNPLESWMTPALVFTSVPIIWGSICWMNAVLPLRFGPSSWVVVALGAIAFGIFMAL